MNKGEEYGFAEDFPGQTDHSETGAGQPSAQNEVPRPAAFRVEGKSGDSVSEVTATSEATIEKRG